MTFCRHCKKEVKQKRGNPEWCDTPECQKAKREYLLEYYKEYRRKNPSKRKKYMSCEKNSSGSNWTWAKDGICERCGYHGGLNRWGYCRRCYGILSDIASDDWIYYDAPPVISDLPLTPYPEEG